MLSSHTEASHRSVSFGGFNSTQTLKQCYLVGESRPHLLNTFVWMTLCRRFLGLMLFVWADLYPCGLVVSSSDFQTSVSCDHETHAVSTISRRVTNILLTLRADSHYISWDQHGQSRQGLVQRKGNFHVVFRTSFRSSCLSIWCTVSGCELSSDASSPADPEHHSGFPPITFGFIVQTSFDTVRRYAERLQIALCRLAPRCSL